MRHLGCNGKELDEGACCDQLRAVGADGDAGSVVLADLSVMITTQHTVMIATQHTAQRCADRFTLNVIWGLPSSSDRATRLQSVAAEKMRARDASIAQAVTAPLADESRTLHWHSPRVASKRTTEPVAVPTAISVRCCCPFFLPFDSTEEMACAVIAAADLGGSRKCLMTQAPATDQSFTLSSPQTCR